MNHKRLDVTVSRESEAAMNEWIDSHKDEIADFDYCEIDSGGRYSFGMRVIPDSLNTLIGKLLQDDHAAVLKYDDVGNAPEYFFGPNIIFTLPSVMSEDQDTISVDRESFGHITQILIDKIRL